MVLFLIFVLGMRKIGNPYCQSYSQLTCQLILTRCPPTNKCHVTSVRPSTPPQVLSPDADCCAQKATHQVFNNNNKTKQEQQNNKDETRTMKQEQQNKKGQQINFNKTATKGKKGHQTRTIKQE